MRESECINLCLLLAPVALPALAVNEIKAQGQRIYYSYTGDEPERVGWVEGQFFPYYKPKQIMSELVED